MLSDLTFLHGHYTPRCDARVDKRFVGYYTLQFGVSGGVELFYGDERHLLTDDRAWFWTAYPGPRVRFHASPGRDWWEHRYVAFRGPRVTHWLAEGIYPDRPFAPPPATVPDLTTRFDRMVALSQQTDRRGVARAINLLEGILLEIAAERDRSEAEPEEWLRVALEHLTGDPAPDYPALAARCGMSLSTLRRRFRVATGTPLHEYALQTRAAAARALLVETDLPVKAVAERLGYRDVYFFTRQFRRLVGVPPAAYRRSRQS
jgi:AraC-like DNA-binding protein